MRCLRGRVVAIGFGCVVCFGQASAQQGYSYPQLRLVRQIASATAMAELCGAAISQAKIAAALKSVGLSLADFEGPFLRDERAKQRIGWRDSYEAPAMTIVGRPEAFRRQCVTLASYYGPAGRAIPGLAVLGNR
jgi:hypothetical protein